jgi:zinc transport system substrate-binding protein
LIKNFSIILAAFVLLTGLSGCNSGIASDSGLNIVTTVFPIYDWVNNILGDNRVGAEVSLLLDSGVDLHSFQPSAEDIMKISSCDLFIYVGGVSDSWVSDALKEPTNKNIRVLNLIDTLGDTAKEEELIEGMQEHNHEHEHEYEHEHEHEHDGNQNVIEYDEHVWLSLKNAALFVDAISSSLEEIDAENAGIYRNNAESYTEKLISLDDKYHNVISRSSTKTLIFADRFPFRYLVDDYGLDYYAAFTGCSAETEATFETIIFLSDMVDELSLGAVIKIDGSDDKLALTVIENTKSKNQKILTLDSIQSITAKDIKNGAAYLSIMEDNLKVLTEALN